MLLTIFIDVRVISLFDSALGITTVLIVVGSVTIIPVDVVVVNSLTNIALVVVTALIGVKDSVPFSIIPGDDISLFDVVALADMSDAVGTSLVVAAPLPDVMAVLVKDNEEVCSLLNIVLEDTTNGVGVNLILDGVLTNPTADLEFPSLT